MIETNETPEVSYTIAKSDLELAIAKINKANRRATRIGQPGYAYGVTEADPLPIYPEIERGDNSGFDSMIKPVPLYYIEQVTITITGMIPRIGEWEVIALLENDEFAGCVSRMFPGIKDADLTSVRIDSMECDHCRKNRRRSKTYVLRDQAGSLIKVGKGCVTLYTGIFVSASFANPAMALDDDMEDLVNHRDAGGDLCALLDDVIRLAVGAVEVHGWKSRKSVMESGGTATADHVIGAFGSSILAREQRELFEAEADAERVSAIVEYVRSLTPDGGEYRANLIACCQPTMVGWKNFGIVASAVAAYDHHLSLSLIHI